MINAAHMCQYPSCKNQATSSCYFCQQEAYQSPFVQHNTTITNEVNSLIDRMNTVADSMTTILITPMRGTLGTQLQQWRDENINLINKIYKQKQVELNAKIVHLDAILSQIKVEKQQEITQIRLKITELVNVGGPTSEQMNRLRKLVDQIAIDLDKLRVATIRIETQPTNIDTCRIIYVDPILNVPPENVTASVSKTRITDDVRHFNKAPTHTRPSPTKPIPTMRHKQAPTVPTVESPPTNQTFHSPGPSSTSQSHIPMPPPIPDTPHTPKSSHIPMPPPVSENSHSSKDCHSPSLSESLDLSPLSRSPEIPMPPYMHETSQIPMPPPIPKSRMDSTSNHIPMPPPLNKSSNIPMPPPVSTPSSVPLRTIKRYGKHQVMFE
ncbi:hypothetical protein I4U23_009173 [Adineta vaga]|nr:hypothetical protein I4U23_009173 [Adineta vaga]